MPADTLPLPLPTDSSTPILTKCSGGPRTAAGKARAARNAATHGLRSASPVLPHLERQGDWLAHRHGVLATLNPSGDLETALAERVALTLWRLRRVARYEAAVATRAAPTAAPSTQPKSPPEADPAARRAADYRQIHLAALRDDLDTLERYCRLLTTLTGLDDDAPIETEDAFAILDTDHDLPGFVYRHEIPKPRRPDGTPKEFDGWTAGLVRHGIAHFAARAGHPAGTPVGEFIALMDSRARSRMQAMRAELLDNERQLDARERQAREDRLRLERDTRHARLLPAVDALDRVVRYEQPSTRGAQGVRG
jgi:hypothetical protein